MAGRQVETTGDGRYVVVNGRRWRATDPSIPDRLRTELVAELMAARRDVRTDPVTARPRVHDAKVSLGERGEPWWEATPAGRHERLVATMLVLLRHRRPEATICPSDAARVVGGSPWRTIMDEARAAAAELAGLDIIEVRQHGVRVDPADAVGALRLGRGPRW